MKAQKMKENKLLELEYKNFFEKNSWLRARAHSCKLSTLLSGNQMQGNHALKEKLVINFGCMKRAPLTWKGYSGPLMRARAIGIPCLEIK